MKQQNFLFVDVVSSIFLLTLLISNFLGLLYITDGNFSLSLLISALVIISYYFVLQLLKRSKERLANKGYKDLSMCLFFIFFVFGAASFLIMTHLTNIESHVKPQLQAEANQVLTDVQGVSSNYDSIATDALQTFEAQLKQKLREYKQTRSQSLWDVLTNDPYNIPESVLKSPSNTINVVESGTAIIQAHRSKIERNKKEIDSVLVKRVEESAYSILYWDRLKIMNSYQGLNKNLIEMEKAVNIRIGELPVAKQPIKIVHIKSSLPLDNPIQLARLYRPDYLIPAIIILIMHLFILIPFFTERVRIYPKTHKNDTSDQQHGAIEM